MIWVAMALASASASIACGITLPAAEEDEARRGERPNGEREPTSTLGATLPAPGDEGDAGVSVQSDAGPPAPPNPIPTTRPFGVFVTSGTWSSDQIGGVTGADALCKAAADKTFTLAGRKWVAWLSSGASPAISRFGDTPGPWYNGLNQVADKQAQLVDPVLPLYSKIALDEWAGSHSDDVWTGTLSDGKASSDTCSGWAGNNGQGTVGRIDFQKPNWTNDGRDNCDGTYQQSGGNTQQTSKPKNRLYCFEIE